MVEERDKYLKILTFYSKGIKQLRAFENSVYRRIFGLQWEGVIEC